MEENTRPNIRIVEDDPVSPVPEAAAGPEKMGFALRLITGLFILDAAVIKLVRAIWQAVIDGFAEHGAAQHGYTLSAHTKVPREPEKTDRPQLYLVATSDRPRRHSSASSSPRSSVASVGYRTWVR